jgi:hypothetical protein
MGREGRSPTGCNTLPTIDALKAQWRGDRLMKKNSTVATNRKEIFKEPKLTFEEGLSPI